MKKKVTTFLLTLTLFVTTIVTITAAGTGIYTKGEEGKGKYYSPEYLCKLTVAERVAVLNEVNNKPDDAIVVVGSKYQKFNNYSGLSSLQAGADDVLPTVVQDVANGIFINPSTGEEVFPGEVINVTGELLEDNIAFLDLDKYTLSFQTDSDSIVTLLFTTDQGETDPGSVDLIGGEATIDSLYTNKNASKLIITALDVMGNEVELAQSEFDLSTLQQPSNQEEQLEVLSIN